MQLKVQLLMDRALVVLREQVHRMSGARGTVPWAPDTASSPATLAMKDKVPLSFWAVTMLRMVNTNWASLETPGEGEGAGPRAAWGGVRLPSRTLAGGRDVTPPRACSRRCPPWSENRAQPLRDSR